MEAKKINVKAINIINELITAAEVIDSQDIPDEDDVDYLHNKINIARDFIHELGVETFEIEGEKEMDKNMNIVDNWINGDKGDVKTLLHEQFSHEEKLKLVDYLVVSIRHQGILPIDAFGIIKSMI